jgi:hypothetical protein
MAVLQVQGLDEASCPPRPGDDVVATVHPPSLSKMSTSSLHVHQDEVGAFYRFLDTEEDLPPYESVVTETFVVSRASHPDCNSLKAIQHSSNDRACQCVEGCPDVAGYDDCVFFPPDSASLSEEDSSVVSCFTDDFSDGSESLGGFNFGSSIDSSPQSSPVSVVFVPDSGHLRDDEADEWSNRFVANWLSKTNATVEDTWLHETSPSANGDGGRLIEPTSSKEFNCSP